MSEKTIIATMELSANEWFEFMAWRKKVNPKGLSHIRDHNGYDARVEIAILDETEAISEVMKIAEELKSENYKLLSDEKYYQSKKYIESKR